MPISPTGPGWPDRPGVVLRVVHHPLTAAAGKSAIAAGAAYWLGSLLPEPLRSYNYYAALGAFTVMVPAVTESLRESVRAFAAIATGVTLAVLLQWAAWTNAVTVGLAVGAGTALAGIPWYRGQRSFVPAAALFVLAVGGSDPERYVLGYITQIPLGALVGVAVNFLLFPPLPVHELDAASAALRESLVGRLRGIAELLGREEEPDLQEWQAHLARFGPERARLREAVDEARRARRANPRAGRARATHQALFEVSEALLRCSSAVEAVGFVIVESIEDEETALDGSLRPAVATVFRRLADVLDDPAGARGDSEHAREARASIRALLDAVDASRLPHREGRYLAGAMAISARRCLDAFVREYGRHVAR